MAKNIEHFIKYLLVIYISFFLFLRIVYLVHQPNLLIRWLSI